MMHFEKTELLNIAFEMAGPLSGSTVFLLHGWPDAPGRHITAVTQDR